MASLELVLKGGTVVNHDGEGIRDIGIAGGRIAEIGAIEAGRARQSLDCTGLHILPGVIDSQVHLREPGNEHQETLASGGEAAAAALGAGAKGVVSAGVDDEQGEAGTLLRHIVHDPLQGDRVILDLLFAFALDIDW